MKVKQLHSQSIFYWSKVFLIVNALLYYFFENWAICVCSILPLRYNTHLIVILLEILKSLSFLPETCFSNWKDILSFLLARTCERSEIFLLLAGSEVCFPHFMVAGRKHDTLGSETKDIVVEGSSRSWSVNIHNGSLSPKSQRIMQRTM